MTTNLIQSKPSTNEQRFEAALNLINEILKNSTVKDVSKALQLSTTSLNRIRRGKGSDPIKLRFTAKVEQLFPVTVKQTNPKNKETEELYTLQEIQTLLKHWISSKHLLKTQLKQILEKENWSFSDYSFIPELLNATNLELDPIKSVFESVRRLLPDIRKTIVSNGYSCVSKVSDNSITTRKVSRLIKAKKEDLFTDAPHVLLVGDENDPKKGREEKATNKFTEAVIENLRPLKRVGCQNSILSSSSVTDESIKGFSETGSHFKEATFTSGDIARVDVLHRVLDLLEKIVHKT